MNISGRQIESLDGLSYFKHLKKLNANNNRITNMEALFGNNSITVLYIMNNRFGNKLTLKNLTKLETLGAARNKLAAIDLTGTENIKSLYLMENALAEIDLKGLPQLENAAISGNKLLKSIDISLNPNLTGLYLLETGISELNVSKNPLLESLYVEPAVKLIRGNSQVKPAPIIREN